MVCGGGVVGDGSGGGDMWGMFQALHCKMLSRLRACMGVCIRARVMRFARGPRVEVGGLKVGVVLTCVCVDECVVEVGGRDLGFFCCGGGMEGLRWGWLCCGGWVWSRAFSCARFGRGVRDMDVLKFESCGVVLCGVFFGRGGKGVQGPLLRIVCVVEFMDDGSET